MKLRPILSALLGVALVAGAGLGVAHLTAPAPAGAAQEADDPPATASLPDVLYDEQNIRTNDAGQHLLRFEDGEHGSSCLSGKALYVGVAPARNLDDPGNAPVTWQAVQHTACNVLVVLLNKANQPIRDADLRITYTASAVPGLTGVPGAPAPAPELTSPAVLAAMVEGLSDEAIVALGLTCDLFASQADAQAVYDAAGGASGPLASLEGPDSDALACSTDGEGVPA